MERAGRAAGSFQKKKKDELLAGERLCSPVLPRALLPCPEQLAFDQTAAILFFI
jgi:hypothetical protein